MSTSSGSGPERRASPRFEIRLPARVRVGDRTVEAETVNISRDGVLLGADELPEGARVHVEILLEDHGWQRLEADVVRRSPASGDGVAKLAARFAQVASDGSRDAIRAFLDGMAP